MPPAHNERIQSTERSGPFHTIERRPWGRSTRATSGTPRSSSTQCHADAAMTTSNEELSLGISSARPARISDSRVTGRQDRPHPFVGLDGGHVRHPFGQEPGEDSGARPDLEDVRGSLRQQPIEGFGRRTGPKPVVVVGHGAEGPAQDGGGLVLAHAAEFSEVRSDRSAGRRWVFSAPRNGRPEAG